MRLVIDENEYAIFSRYSVLERIRALSSNPEAFEDYGPILMHQVGLVYRDEENEEAVDYGTAIGAVVAISAMIRSNVIEEEDTKARITPTAILAMLDKAIAEPFTRGGEQLHLSDISKDDGPSRQTDLGDGTILVDDRDILNYAGNKAVAAIRAYRLPQPYFTDKAAAAAAESFTAASCWSIDRQQILNLHILLGATLAVWWISESYQDKSLKLLAYGLMNMVDSFAAWAVLESIES